MMDKELELCKKENLTINEEVICDQHILHKSMIDNPLAFVLFYLFSIIFIALLFQLSQRKISKKDKKNK
tara:strand:- start:167 stop:373 length:207 start_codon:yes stop_codon:yes gene_type:complete